MKELENQADLNLQSNGVYTTKGDLMNVYIVRDGCWFRLQRSQYDIVIADAIGSTTVVDLVTLRTGGFSVDDIKAVKPRYYT